MRAGRIALVAMLLLAGCASSGPTGSEVLTASLKPNTARLVIYRSSPLGFAVQPDYLIDGKKVGISTPNGFVVCELRPGRHEVAVGNMPLNVNFFGGSEKLTLNLRPGATAYLHAQPQPGLTVGIITLSEVSENQGRSDTASLYKIESDCKGA